MNWMLAKSNASLAWSITGKILHHEVMQEFYRDKIFFKNYIPYLSDVERWALTNSLFLSTPTAAM